MKVINLWAGPGAGKSTTAAGLFARMKNAGKRVELVTERAKELVYENSDSLLHNQLLLLGEQDQRLRRLIGKVDYAITDTPLPLSIIYAPKVFQTDWFKKVALGVFDTYDNVNVQVLRTKVYQKYGRTQDYKEARELDAKVFKLMHDNRILLDLTVEGNDTAPFEIANYIQFLDNMESDGFNRALQPR